MKIETMMAPVKQLAKQLEDVNWSRKETYADYCAQTYFYVRHSTRLIALCAAHMPMDQETAHQRLLQHVGEENKHEILSIRDVKALGYAITDFKEHASTRAFYQTQYFQIQNRSPFAFFGYVLALESLAVEKGQWLMEEVKKHHGTKPIAFLQVHANEDIEHVEKAIQTIQSLPEEAQLIVADSLETSCNYYGNMLMDVNKNHSTIGRTAKKTA